MPFALTNHHCYCYYSCSCGYRVVLVRDIALLLRQRTGEEISAYLSDTLVDTSLVLLFFMLVLNHVLQF